MARFIVRRLLWLIPSILIVTFVVYVVCRIGWNPVASYSKANPRATPEQVDQFKKDNSLYPGFRGYVRGYFEWLGNFLRGPDHWPKSIQGGGEVWEPLRHSFFNTLRLAGTAAVLGIGFGVSVGVLASRKPGGWLDTCVNTTAFFVGGIPSFVSAVFLQLVFAVQLGWLPPAGVYPPGHEGFDLWEMIKHMILPVGVVAVQTIGQYARFTRASVLDVSSADYLRTARSKGIPERNVLFKHSLRNALIPIVTIAAIEIGQLVTGLIVTENIFHYPGLGKYFLDAATIGDFPKLLPFLVILTTSVIVFNLISDVAYTVLDPRISLD